MTEIDIKTKDTIFMLKQQIDVKGHNTDYIDWIYIEGFINRQIQEVYQYGLKSKFNVCTNDHKELK